MRSGELKTRPGVLKSAPVKSPRRRRPKGSRGWWARLRSLIWAWWPWALGAAEHHSNIIPWLLACRMRGARLRAAPLHANGDAEVDAFGRMLNERVRVVSVSHMSNVTGPVFPVKEMTGMAHERGIPVVVDGEQAVPHMPVDVRDIGCEFYAGSGHK